MRHLPLYLMLLSLALACSVTTASGPDAAGVEVQTSATGVTIANTGASQLYYFVSPMSIAVRSELYACVDAPDCTSLPPGGRASVGWTALGGLPDETSYMLYTWRARRDGDVRAAATDLHGRPVYR